MANSYTPHSWIALSSSTLTLPHTAISSNMHTWTHGQACLCGAHLRHKLHALHLTILLCMTSPTNLGLKSSSVLLGPKERPLPQMWHAQPSCQLLPFPLKLSQLASYHQLEGWATQQSWNGNLCHLQ